MRPKAILESALYVDDLDAAEHFYKDVFDLPVIGRVEGRHVFFRCGDGVLLLFNPETTSKPPAPDAAIPAPPHGAHGQGHLCFRATEAEIDAWKTHLDAKGIPIELEFNWPQGGRSIYFRDPSGNALEIANPLIWGMD